MPFYSEFLFRGSPNSIFKRQPNAEHNYFQCVQIDAFKRPDVFRIRTWTMEIISGKCSIKWLDYTNNILQPVGFDD